MNVETSKIYPAIFFYNQMGEQLDAGMVVDLGGDLMITEDGGVAPAMGLKGLGEITISTHGRGALVIGSAKVFSDGRVGGVLRFTASRPSEWPEWEPANPSGTPYSRLVG